jgi:maleylpyruvate isomerase
MKLYTYFRSGAAFRVRIALNFKHLSYEAIPRHLLRNGGEHLRADYLALNPQGLVPLLEHEGTAIAQSLAIIEYLEERYPNPPLLPTDTVQRAQIRAMALGIACDTTPLQNLRVTQYLSQEFKHSDDDIDRWRHKWMALGFAALETLVARHSGDGKHCFGCSVTLADVFLLPQIYSAKRFNLSLDPYPKLRTIAAHLDSLPVFVQAAPQAQPDAE